MEGLIMVLILMAIGAFFNNKKPNSSKRPSDDQRYPASKGQRTLKRVEEYAREKYSELQTQMSEHPEQAKRVMDRVEQAKAKLPQREIEKAVKPVVSTGRLSVHKTPEELQEKVQSDQRSELFPLKEEDLQKAIIFSEILLPPKSKR